MQSGDKRLKGKEMSVPDSNNMEQIQCAEGDRGGEEIEKEAEAGLRVGGRGIGNVVELAAAEIKGMGLSAVERTGTAAAEDNRRHGHDRCPSKWRERGRGYERWR